MDSWAPIRTRRLTHRAAFPVHANGFGTQEQADVDTDGEGNFVVVWETDRNGSLDIFGRRFLSDGQAIGLEFQINSYSVGSQRFPQAE